MSNVVPMTSSLEMSWNEYAAACERAQKSRLLADGVEAGRAWRRWLELFMTEEQKARVGVRT